MEEKKKFNEKEYKYNWLKTHKKEFRAYIDTNEYEELEQLLKEKGITKVDFLRKAFEELKKS